MSLMKTQARKALDKAQALNSPAVQQVLINEVEKVIPGWFEAGGDLDTNGYAVTLHIPYGNKAIAELIKSVDFWTLPADNLSCSTKTYQFTKQKTFVMPQYNDVEIILNICISWDLPEDDLSTLRMLGKVRMETPSYIPSYHEAIVCTRADEMPF